jgi:large subunit ribosomal protein L28
MPKFYKITRKNSAAHKEILESRKHTNDSVVRVDATHVFVPAARPIDVGMNVSHAKNRTIRRRLPNLKTVTVEVEGVNRTLQLTARDLRTYKKLTVPAKQA